MTKTRAWVWFGPNVLVKLAGQLLDVTLLDHVSGPNLVPALLPYLCLNIRNEVAAPVSGSLWAVCFSPGWAM